MGVFSILEQCLFDISGSRWFDYKNEMINMYLLPVLLKAQLLNQLRMLPLARYICTGMLVLFCNYAVGQLKLYRMNEDAYRHNKIYPCDTSIWLDRHIDNIIYVRSKGTKEVILNPAFGKVYNFKNNYAKVILNDSVWVDTVLLVVKDRKSGNQIQCKAPVHNCEFVFSFRKKLQPWSYVLRWDTIFLFSFSNSCGGDYLEKFKIHMVRLFVIDSKGAEVYSTTVLKGNLSVQQQQEVGHVWYPRNKFFVRDVEIEKDGVVFHEKRTFPIRANW